MDLGPRPGLANGHQAVPGLDCVPQLFENIQTVKSSGQDET